MSQNRSLVLWLGQEPSKKTESSFQILELSIRNIKSEDNLKHDVFSSSCALIISVPTNKASLFYKTEQSLLIPALDHGLIVIVECSAKDLVGINSRIVEKNFDKNRVVTIIKNPEYPNELPTRVFKYFANVGPSYNENCKIYPEINNLKEHQKLYLKRAFSDCKEIHLQSLKPGFSSSGIFCIHAMIENEQPMPFFAKFDNREKISKERDNYINHVLPLVPFNLRPNIDLNRSILGESHGLLVGNFVENATSLWDTIISGNSKAAINSLFEDSLRAWRHPINPYESENHLFINTFKQPKSEEKESLRSRWLQAKKYSEDVESPEQLIILLINLKLKFVNTRVHGDLHTENVQVRNNEAILIDFTKVHWGPSSIDSAALEVWIAFYKWPDKPFEEWQATIDKLYSLTNGHIELPKVKHHPENDVSIWNTIRQIRTLAFPLLSDNRHSEYQGCLAYWMYKFATYPLNLELVRSIEARHNEEQRRVYAYYLACKLISNIEK